MCGICGIVNYNNKSVQESIIQNMIRTMKHRGPDDEGIFCENNIGMGFVRLSIIDLSTAGHQPMVSHDQRYVLTFNGEIYNYLEIRKDLQRLGYEFRTQTDTEVLLQSFIHWGEDCVNHFNGMWAFVLYDRMEKKVFASRDRYGVKPFYYLNTPGFFAYASEIPPLLTLLDRYPQPDNQTIFDYLNYNRTDQNDNTFFKDIKKLQHGQNISVSTKLSIKKWYDLSKAVENTIGFESDDQFKNLFQSSIELRLRSDVPVGVCLSGGMDSSSITSVILNNFKMDGLNTFSAIYGNYKTDESKYMNLYRSQCDNMFFTKPNCETLINDFESFVMAHGEPVPSGGPYVSFKVMELAKGKVKVLLNGQGADEYLAGYHYFFGYYYKSLLKSFRLLLLYREMFVYYTKNKNLDHLKYFVFSLFPSIGLSSRKNHIVSNRFASQFHKSDSIQNFYSANNLSEFAINHFEYKLEHLLKWEDRNSMWHSIESRVPFLDYRLVERSLATSAQMIINDAETKYILRNAMRGVVPEPILNRYDKIGFGSPLDIWFDNPKFQRFFEIEVSRSEEFLSQYFNMKKVREVFSNSKGSSDKKEIWKIINLALWHKKFLN